MKKLNVRYVESMNLKKRMTMIFVRIVIGKMINTI